MHLALTKLGHKVYHFKEVGQRDLPGELPHGLAWREAFAAKMYGNGKPFGKPEFDKLLKRYSVSEGFSNKLARRPVKFSPRVDTWSLGCNGRPMLLLCRRTGRRIPKS